MSTTTAAAPDLDKTPPGSHVASSPLAAWLATLTALVATVLALVDLFTHGLWPTCLHLAVGLVVFGLVRLCIGLALGLEAFIPTENPESST
ncbi:hypothetical protein [Streptomyces venezuelae]|uniref:hypothetical protein n=1 Tax=Streptomyces venezuelae TaxID=54571 RepID=UPI003441B4F7